MDRDEIIADAIDAIGELTRLQEAAVGAVVDHVREQTGETIAVRKPGILDASLADLFGMESQARAYLEAMKAIRKWIVPGESVPLGHRLKVIPSDEAEKITRHLRDAGVLR